MPARHHWETGGRSVEKLNGERRLGSSEGRGQNLCSRRLRRIGEGRLQLWRCCCSTALLVCSWRVLRWQHLVHLSRQGRLQAKGEFRKRLPTTKALTIRTMTQAALYLACS